MRSNRDFHVVAAIACASAMVPACASAPLATDDGVREGALIGESGAFPIRYEVVDGKALFEGDILLEGSRGGNGPHAESFTLGERSAVLGRLWPNGIIPVRFDPSIDDAMKQTIAAAMVDWMTKTGLTLFVDTASSAKDYVLFQAGTGGCNSGFGYYPGVNIVNLSVGCNRLDTAVHEIGHRIGLYHEHTRPDRDQYLRVVDANISGHQDQFTPRAWGDGAMPTAFDFDSVMLYNSFTTDTSFAKDTSKPVMTKLDGTSTWVSQDGSGLSAGDVAGVAALYRITSANSWNAGSGMAAVARDAGSMDTFVIGKNGGLFDAGWWSAATNHWNTPYPIGSANVWVAGGGVAAVSRTPGSIDTFVIGKDGALWNAAWSSGPGAAWNGGYAISAPRTFDAGAGIAAVCRDASSTDTFVIGSDGALWNAGWWSAATGEWHGRRGARRRLDGYVRDWQERRALRRRLVERGDRPVARTVPDHGGQPVVTRGRRGGGGPHAFDARRAHHRHGRRALERGLVGRGNEPLERPVQDHEHQSLQAGSGAHGHRAERELRRGLRGRLQRLPRRGRAVEPLQRLADGARRHRGGRLPERRWNRRGIADVHDVRRLRGTGRRGDVERRLVGRAGRLEVMGGRRRVARARRPSA
jgi:hypothetical protein